jgi:hypothetical protein
MTCHCERFSLAFSRERSVVGGNPELFIPQQYSVTKKFFDSMPQMQMNVVN